MQQEIGLGEDRRPPQVAAAVREEIGAVAALLHDRRERQAALEQIVSAHLRAPRQVVRALHLDLVRPIGAEDAVARTA